jgi:YVTN family beta-propeller protein
MEAVPVAAAVHPDGTFVYVAGGGSVSVVDVATNRVVARVPIGGGSAGVSVHPTGAFVYVANPAAGTVAVLETASNAVVATVPVGGRPISYGLFVGPTLPGVSLTLNQSTFHPGQTLTVRATTYGGAEPRLVDAYVEGRLPDGTIGFLQADGTFTADRRPIASNVSVGPSSGEVARHTFDGTHPAGSYRLQGYFTEPGTSSVIGLVAHAAFTVGP